MDNPHDHSLADYCARFESLVQKANEHGLNSVVILCEDNPTTGELGITWFAKGNPMNTTGLTVNVRKQMIGGPL